LYVILITLVGVPVYVNTPAECVNKLVNPAVAVVGGINLLTPAENVGA